MKGHRAEAAKALNMSERNLYRKIIEYGLDWPAYLAALISVVIFSQLTP